MKSSVDTNQLELFREDQWRKNRLAHGGTYDPVLLELVRKAYNDTRNTLAHDIVSVQPMTAPSGLVFYVEKDSRWKRLKKKVKGLFHRHVLCRLGRHEWWHSCWSGRGWFCGHCNIDYPRETNGLD
jgi:hypothetical protein